MHKSIDSALGHRREMREDDREEVECHRDSETVKVAAAQRLTILEDERIIGRRVELAGDGVVDPVESVEHGPVDLRHAAKRIRVLDARIAVTVRLAHLALGEQITEESG